MNIIVQNILFFLRSRGWQELKQTDRFIELTPPNAFQLPEDFRLHIPMDEKKTDFLRVVDNLIAIIADFYDLSIDDLGVLLRKQNAVLKVRIHDEHTEDGKIGLTRFEHFIERIKSILADTASFVIDKKVESTRVPAEVERYLNLCKFLQTQKGSFVANIQLPSKELIKDRELFDRAEVYSQDINNKLLEVLDFVNNDILESNKTVDDEYLIEHEDKINIKLYKDLELFYNRTNVKNIDFSFHSIGGSQTITCENITQQKLNRLSNFIEQVESNVFEVGDFECSGKIVTLKSKDPDGLRNTVVYTGIFDNLPLIITANLTSEHYKEAIEAHKDKKTITIAGLAKRTKSRARFIEITKFEIVN